MFRITIACFVVATVVEWTAACLLLDLLAGDLKAWHRCLCRRIMGSGAFVPLDSFGWILVGFRLRDSSCYFMIFVVVKTESFEQMIILFVRSLQHYVLVRGLVSMAHQERLIDYCFEFLLVIGITWSSILVFGQPGHRSLDLGFALILGFVS